MLLSLLLLLCSCGVAGVVEVAGMVSQSCASASQSNLTYSRIAPDPPHVAPVCAIECHASLNADEPAMLLKDAHQAFGRFGLSDTIRSKLVDLAEINVLMLLRPSEEFFGQEEVVIRGASLGCCMRGVIRPGASAWS